MMIRIGLILAIVAITMNAICFGMLEPHMRLNLEKLFSRDPNDAMSTVEEAQSYLLEASKIMQGRYTSELDKLMFGALYEYISSLDLINKSQVCDYENLHLLHELEKEFHDYPNIILLLQRPHVTLIDNCQHMILDRIRKGNLIANDNSEEWLALSKTIHSIEPNLLHRVANGRDLYSALRQTVTETMKTLQFVDLIGWRSAQAKILQLKSNLCKSNHSITNYVLFGEYLGIDREKTFLDGLTLEQQDLLIKKLVCNWLEKVDDYSIWDAYIASQNTMDQLFGRLFDSKSKKLKPDEVHMSLRVLSRYNEISDLEPSRELDDMKLAASNVLVPLDHPKCTSNELAHVDSYTSMINPQNIKIYHHFALPMYLDRCKGKMLMDFEVEPLTKSELMKHMLNKVLEAEEPIARLDMHSLKVSDKSVIIGLKSSAKLIEKIKMDYKLTIKSRVLSKIANMQTKMNEECAQIARASLETKSKFADLHSSLYDNIRPKLWNLVSESLKKLILVNDICNVIGTINPERVYEMKDTP